MASQRGPLRTLAYQVRQEFASTFAIRLMRVAEARLIDILTGCGIALGIGCAPWPSSWHAHVPRDLAAVVRLWLAREATGYLTIFCVIRRCAGLVQFGVIGA